MLIHTTKGMVERDQLAVKDIVEEHENARVTATEWYMGDELVRRDVNVNILRGLQMGAEQESVGG
jgi:hypothetical protein